MVMNGSILNIQKPKCQMGWNVGLSACRFHLQRIIWIIEDGARVFYNAYYEEVTDMKEVVIKSIGLAATVVGLGATLVTDWVNDKKLDAKIAEKIAEALAKEKGL